MHSGCFENLIRFHDVWLRPICHAEESSLSLYFIFFKWLVFFCFGVFFCCCSSLSLSLSNIKRMCHVVVEDFYHRDFAMAMGNRHVSLSSPGHRFNLLRLFILPYSLTFTVQTFMVHSTKENEDTLKSLKKKLDPFRFYE